MENISIFSHRPSTRGWLAVAISVLVIPGCAEGGRGGLAPLTTAIEGSITSNTEWTPAEGPYLITDDVVVENSATLTIHPGTEVWFNMGGNSEPGPSILVHGTLKAIGTATDRILFRSAIHSGVPLPVQGKGREQRWGNIHFAPDATGAMLGDDDAYLEGSVLSYCTLEDAGNSAVFAEGCSPLIYGCEFRRNASLWDKGEVIVLADRASRRIKGGAIHAYRLVDGLHIAESSFSDNRSLGVSQK